MIYLKNNIKTQIQNLVYEYLLKLKTPGISVSVLKENQIFFHQGFGARNLEKDLPMTHNTLIGIGSVTKSFTAMAIMQLVEKGKFSLDDKVCDIIDIKLPQKYKGEPIKLKHILSHSSGIPSLDLGMNAFNIFLNRYNKLVPSTNRDDFIHFLENSISEIAFKPGKKFFYNNDFFTLAGFIIEKYSGMDYIEYIRKNILQPLNMKRTAFLKSELMNDPENNFMQGYLPNKDAQKIIKIQEFPYDKYLYAPGGIITSTDEMLNYGKCLLNHGNFGEKQLLNEKSIQELFTPRISTLYGKGKNPQYCFGWVKEDDFFGHTLIHHGGSVGVSCSFLALIPELNIAVAVSANDGNGAPSILGRGILTLLLGKDCHKKDLTLRYMDILKKIEGTYQSFLDLYTMEVKFENGILNAEIEIDDGKFAYPLLLVDENELIFKIGTFIPQSNAYIHFVTEENNSAVKFVTYDRYLYHKK